MFMKPRTSSKVAGAPRLKPAKTEIFPVFAFLPEPAEVRKQLEQLVLRPQ